MKLLPTTRAQIRTIADRWRRRFYLESSQSWLTIRRGREFVSAGIYYDRLLALDVEIATPSDVEKIIGIEYGGGASGWVGQLCCECGEPYAVALVGDPDDDDSVVALCESCIRRLVSLVKAE